MTDRIKQIEQWLAQEVALKVTSLLPASEDASFRRYFRVICEAHEFSQSKSLIVMDAPPQRESIEEFIEIAHVLSENNVHAPTIYATNTTQGFVLLEDLGSRTYLNEVTNQSAALYANAINALIKLQTIGSNDDSGFTRHGFNSDFQPPHYSENLIETELDLFVNWYCAQHKQIELSQSDISVWNELKNKLTTVFSDQPQCWVHRDYHSRNLMITEENSPGVIDFQDMVWGPISYDLASIFKDCYIAWPRERQIDWLNDYLTQITTINPTLNVNIDELLQWYDLTGLQRHLKVLGIFSRLNYRDNKSHYLNDLPLVEKYIREVLDLYPEFNDFRFLFNKVSR